MVLPDKERNDGFLFSDGVRLLGTVVILLALILILAAVGFYVYKRFAIPGEPMPPEWWIALTLRVVLSLPDRRDRPNDASFLHQP